MSQVFVIQHDGGYEGHSGAVAVCRTVQEARRVKKMLSAAGDGCWSIFCAPLWPEGMPEVEWFNLKPLKDIE